MGDATSISWTDATWNPVRGCSRVSEGCRNCYAERVAARFSGPGMPYEGLARTKLVIANADERDAGNRREARWTGEVRLVAEHLADPLRWRRSRRIFVNSMSDLFHEKLTNEQIAAVFGVMTAAPRHTFQVLTKRARRMREWFEWVAKEPTSLITIPTSPRLVCRGEAGRQLEAADEGYRPMLGTESQPRSWPLPNVWLGVSVENQDEDHRIAELLETPAAVHFLSCEPLLGTLDIYRWLRCEDCTTDQPDHCRPDRAFVDWVIAGCESGTGARTCDVAWLRSLRDQCEAASVPFFLKQAVELRSQDAPDGVQAGDMHPVAIGRGARRKSAGVIELPYLDGEQHAAFPEAR